MRNRPARPDDDAAALWEALDRGVDLTDTADTADTADGADGGAEPAAEPAAAPARAEES
jgi:hypothetical protein